LLNKKLTISTLNDNRDVNMNVGIVSFLIRLVPRGEDEFVRLDIGAADAEGDVAVAALLQEPERKVRII
jgi:hypothetical protein